MDIITIETPTLGDRSYLVTDGEVGFAVDVQRDIDRFLAPLRERGVRLSHVFETHVHNDYVTGGPALARVTGAAYAVPAGDAAAAHLTVGDGDRVDVAPGLAVRVLATPGHTFGHVSYVLEREGEPVAVFTGGSLLYGSVGRPDLLGDEHTDELARAQWRSARRLAAELPGSTALHPTHGFGSFCSSGGADVDSSTVAREARENPVLTQDEQEYVDGLLASLDAYPAYYAHMAPLNLAGPAAPDLSPPPVADAAELRRRIAAGEWVVDLRTRTAFAAGHVGGTLNLGVDGNLATYLGWLVPWGTPVTLLGESAAQVAEAQRELVRIGIDRPAAHATGDPAAWSAGGALQVIRRVGFADLARPPDDAVVLDVRRRTEWEAGHVRGAVHVPLHELPARRPELPAGELWVHCSTGYRASYAASLLAAAGRAVVLVDDEFDRAEQAGVPLARAAPQAA